MFTKEHYIEIAKVLKDAETTPLASVGGRLLLSKVVQDFVLMLEKDNSKFDAEKFLDIIYGKEDKKCEKE